MYQITLPYPTLGAWNTNKNILNTLDLHLEYTNCKYYDEQKLHTLKQRQSYIVNNVCTFIFKCREMRQKFNEDLRNMRKQRLNINIKLLRSS